VQNRSEIDGLARQQTHRDSRLAGCALRPLEIDRAMDPAGFKNAVEAPHSAEVSHFDLDAA